MLDCCQKGIQIRSPNFSDVYLLEFDSIKISTKERKHLEYVEGKERKKDKTFERKNFQFLKIDYHY